MYTNKGFVSSVNVVSRIWKGESWFIHVITKRPSGHLSLIRRPVVSSSELNSEDFTQEPKEKPRLNFIVLYF